MSLIGVVGLAGSPGVTTLAVALAHRLPAVTDRTALLVEADPDGGVLGVRHGLGASTGLTKLASAARAGIAAAAIDEFASTMVSGVPAIVAPVAAEQVHAALRAAGRHLARAFSELDQRDVVFDLGRLRPSSPAEPLLAECDHLVVLVHPTGERLVALTERLESVRASACAAQVHVVLRGESPYGARDVERALGLDRVGVIADDPRRVASDPAAAGTGRRNRWARSVGELAQVLAGAQVSGDERGDEGGDRPESEERVESTSITVTRA